MPFLAPQAGAQQSEAPLKNAFRPPAGRMLKGKTITEARPSVSPNYLSYGIGIGTVTRPTTPPPSSQEK